MAVNATRNVNPADVTRALQIIARLRSEYPEARIALSYQTPWELVVAVILSAQCTDVMVNRVTEKLFKKYRNIGDYADADPAVFEQDIRKTGFFRNKTKHIIAAAKIVKERYGGRVPDSMDGLLSLPGVARKTANIVLYNAYHITGGIAVDTHVQRISQRLRLVHPGEAGGKQPVSAKINGSPAVDYFRDADSNKVENILMKLLPKSDWSDITYILIEHGRNVCKAIAPNCQKCVVWESCPVAR
ncbi:hypothetical protein A2Z33_03035 [Candidatus Gottesmanbacteria bacterium RBG_16_52_11]|uniref:Endonuclease III n=1 Tax=Candidatus Gottesmanbacteria bacterium RBG_16_52_11 TaxID=1798374 RepID=A0A1F5YVK5_9BACT|nr:MAG: hypothetical protein A2Z33_03035 [Candidatus Gottesmanbacteria bacterium RBG_16_52_11]